MIFNKMTNSANVVHQHSVVKLVLRAKNDEERTVTVLMGHAHDLPPGLETQLGGRAPGDAFEVVLRGPAYDPALRSVVARAEVDENVREGDLLYAEVEHGAPLSLKVVRVSEREVELDANPPDAGREERLHVRLLSVRDAEPGELAHGHVHGDGGVHH